MNGDVELGGGSGRPPRQLYAARREGRGISGPCVGMPVPSPSQACARTPRPWPTIMGVSEQHRSKPWMMAWAADARQNVKEEPMPSSLWSRLHVALRYRSGMGLGFLPRNPVPATLAAIPTPLATFRSTLDDASWRWLALAHARIGRKFAARECRGVTVAN